MYNHAQVHPCDGSMDEYISRFPVFFQTPNNPVYGFLVLLGQMVKYVYGIPYILLMNKYETSTMFTHNFFQNSIVFRILDTMFTSFEKTFCLFILSICLSIRIKSISKCKCLSILSILSAYKVSVKSISKVSVKSISKCK